MRCRVLISADDRTGALEIGGLVADETHSVPVGPGASSERCAVVDIGTRHLTPGQAQARMEALLGRNAEHRAHKMDAGLRGNWPYEVQVLLEARRKVAVVCAFPDAGRRCRDGVVYIHGLPVLESVFGQDPLNAPVSSRPLDVLEHAGVRGDVVVWDADDNDEMHEAIRRANAEGRILVGASGVMGAFARDKLGAGEARRVDLPGPCCVLCGSLNPLSREQIARTELPARTVGSELHLFEETEIEIVATPLPGGPITDAGAIAMAEAAAATIEGFWSRLGTLVVVGGDTAAALVGDDTLDCLGTVAPGIPVSAYRGLCLVTKGGGIGEPDVLREILASINPAPSDLKRDNGRHP